MKSHRERSYEYEYEYKTTVSNDHGKKKRVGQPKEQEKTCRTGVGVGLLNHNVILGRWTDVHSVLFFPHWPYKYH